MNCRGQHKFAKSKAKMFKTGVYSLYKPRKNRIFVCGLAG